MSEFERSQHETAAANDLLLAGLLAVVAAVSTGAALVWTFRTPDDMVPIAVLYGVALASAAFGVRLRRSRGLPSSGFKLLIGTTVLACLVTVVLWSVLGTWSTMGRCERREAMVWHNKEVWYEGTACTDEQREGFYQ
jgi:hypothetical protein